LIIEPQCCGDLSNIQEWREAVEYKGSTWRPLWIGHPWVSVRFFNGMLTISDYHEIDDNNDNEIFPKFRVSPRDLQHAVNIAEYELGIFVDRIKQIRSM
jgi:hypothetical protein